MVRVTVRYWASVRAAAGVEGDVVDAETVSGALAAVADLRPSQEFAGRVEISSVLVDGLVVPRTDTATPLPEGSVVEILPPFAGG